MNVELQDLLAIYPPQDIPGIQQKITAKKEFRDLASKPQEPVPQRGQFYPHQTFVERFMRAWDRFFLMWDTGTGKTCGAVAPNQFFKHIAADPIIRSQIKKSYILVKGPTLRNDFRNQLICKCSAPGEYETELIKRARLETTRKSNITREISKWYRIRTYKKFVNSILPSKGKRVNKKYPNGMSDADIIREYSGCLFYVDEVHNLRSNDPFSGQDETELNTTYRTLWRVFHLMQRSKLMLGSATPMINNVSEIVPVMNLLLPADKQLDPNRDYRTVTLEEMEPYFRGYLSYVRALDTGAIPEYIGQKIQAEYEFIPGVQTPSQSVIYALQMSEHQAAGYRRAQGLPDNMPVEEEVGPIRNAFREAERQAANFVFPDGSFGGTFKRLMKRKEGGPEPVPKGLGKYVLSPAPDVYQITDELRPYLALDQLQRYGCKFAESVRLGLNNPGLAFSYNEFLTGCGAILLAMCFEANGFERFDETRSVFLGAQETGLKPLCGGGRAAGERPMRLQPKLRYALFTSETSETKGNIIMETFNSYENRHGDLIKIFIGSPITRDGINLANVLSIMPSGPGWTRSGMYQELSRAIRSTSHEDILNELREEAIRNGQNPATVKVNVNIYQLAAVTAEGKSVDVEMFQSAEIKDWYIRRMLRMMKQCAVDAQIHYFRNVRPTDVDGSSQCDYAECRYQPVDPAPKFLDESTYDVLYSEPVVVAAMEQIINLFRAYTSVTLPQIYATFLDIRPKFIDAAIERLITSKTVIYDRYGFPSFLRTSGGGNAVFLQRDFPLGNIQDRYSLTYYTEVLIANQVMSLLGYLATLQSGEQGDIIEQIKAMNPANPQFDLALDRLNLEKKIQLLEMAIPAFYLAPVEEPKPPWLAGVLEKFSSSFFIQREPVTLIQQSMTELAEKGKKRGRKPKPGAKPRAKKINTTVAINLENLDTNTEPVFFHTLSNQSYDRTAYNVTAKFNKAEGKIRLLKPSEGVGWRDANAQEYSVYNELAQHLIAQHIQAYEQYDIYGTIYYDKKFRIRDKATEEAELAAKDSRSVNRGRMCNIWTKPKLVQVLWQLRVPAPELVGSYPTRGEMINFLVQQSVKSDPTAFNTTTDEEIRYMYSWLRSNTTRDQICQNLQQWFQDNNRLLVL